MMNEYFFFSSTQGTKLDFERCSSSGVGWEGNGSSEDGPEKVWHPARGSVGGSQEIFVLTHLGQKALPYNLLTNIDYHDPVFYSVIMVKTMIKKKSYYWQLESSLLEISEVAQGTLLVTWPAAMIFSIEIRKKLNIHMVALVLQHGPQFIVFDTSVWLTVKSRGNTLFTFCFLIILSSAVP